MKGSHFALGTAEKKILAFFQDAAARPSSRGNDEDAMEGDDSGEFGCVREGRLYVLPEPQLRLPSVAAGH